MPSIELCAIICFKMVSVKTVETAMCFHIANPATLSCEIEALSWLGAVAPFTSDADPDASHTARRNR